MGFKCGIIGLPNVGKSTLFNALTQSNNAEAANYPFATIEPNIGRIAVPDNRLKKLSNINKSQKTIPTFIDFIDIAGLVKGASRGEGLGNKFLSHIREVDAIAHVVRCFVDENISHVNNTINPQNDINVINSELLISDLQILENKKESINKKIKGGDEKLISYQNLINKLINKIENGEFIDLKYFEKDDIVRICELNLITTKPHLYICNVDELSVINGNIYSKKVDEIAKKENSECVIISASIESQIANIDKEEERQVFLNNFKLTESTLNKVINSGYNLLELITFFTSGPKETRAWTLKNGSNASEAAGKIHSDFEKGFIRAETISYEEYIKYNGEIGSKEAGKLRQEGKEYLVRDGDIFNFLFNV